VPNASVISKVQSPEAAARLAELEGKISQARKGGIEIGRALREIRDDSLFGEHGSFEAYALARWGYQRAYAYRLIQAAALVDEVLEKLRSTRVDIAEKLGDWGNVHAALTLEPVPLGKRLDVLIRAAELAAGIQPSRSHVRRAAAEVLGRVDVDRADERTERFDKAICKLEAMIRHVRDREKPIDRTAMASYLGDILRLVRERKTGRKHAKKENR
jgi:hypothetical protein